MGLPGAAIPDPNFFFVGGTELRPGTGTGVQGGTATHPGEISYVRSLKSVALSCTLGVISPTRLHTSDFSTAGRGS